VRSITQCLLNNDSVVRLAAVKVLAALTTPGGWITSAALAARVDDEVADVRRAAADVAAHRAKQVDIVALAAVVACRSHADAEIRYSADTAFQEVLAAARSTAATPNPTVGTSEYVERNHRSALERSFAADKNEVLPAESMPRTMQAGYPTKQPVKTERKSATLAAERTSGTGSAQSDSPVRQRGQGVGSMRGALKQEASPKKKQVAARGSEATATMSSTASEGTSPTRKQGRDKLGSSMLELSDAQAAQTVVALISKTEWRTRSAAAQILAEAIGDSDSAPSLTSVVKALKESGDWRQRLAVEGAAKILAGPLAGRSHGMTSVYIVVELLGDTDVRVQQRAIAALGHVAAKARSMWESFGAEDREEEADPSASAPQDDSPSSPPKEGAARASTGGKPASPSKARQRGAK